MRELLTGTTDRLAGEAGLVRRRRNVTGSNFAQTLVFTWLADRNASGSRLQTMAVAVDLRARRLSLVRRHDRSWRGRKEMCYRLPPYSLG
jgi:hypothetical protein